MHTHIIHHEKCARKNIYKKKRNEKWENAKQRQACWDAKGNNSVGVMHTVII